MKAIIAAIVFLLSLSNTFGQTTDSPLKISHLTGDFYIYTTYSVYKEHKTPANGMYLLTSKGAVLFDSPWDTTQFQPLLDSIKLRHHQQVVLCIATHFHGDRTAGLEYYRQQGIKTFTTKATDEMSKQQGMKRAEFLIGRDTTFTVGQYSFQTYYPGQAHTADNIVIWFKKEKILYGACLIKSANDKDLGFLGDANKTAYASTIKTVQQKCPQPKFVIVGHGDWTNTHSLQHTLDMAEELRKQNQ